MAQAIEYFTHVPAWQVVVCKQCRVCVWPSQIAGHLQGAQHHHPRKQAQAVADEIQTWPGVQHHPTVFEAPPVIRQPIPELPLYEEAWRCTIERQCTFISPKAETMKRHWRAQHHAHSAHSKGGGSGQTKSRNAQRRFEQGTRPVQCQRLFAQGPHSQWIEVQRPEEATPEQVHSSSAVKAFERAWEQANLHWDTIQAKQAERIEAGEADEVNPWLKRTGWIEYLAGCEGSDLLKAIEQPGADETEEEDPVEAAIWQAMAGVAWKSQRTVARSGVMLRMEAIRTEMHAVKYTPLQAYQDAAAVEKHVRPWQEMLMFFVRTRKPHAWKSPAWRFSRQQHAAFSRMIAEAEEGVSIETESEESEESEDSEDSEDSEEGEDEEDDHRSRRGDRYTQATDETDPPMTALEKACMGFCIELLNQRIHNREYDMALVCGMAVLGVAPIGGGFRDPETYPPIMSSIIKVAHFMVVQHAEDIAVPAEDDHGEFSPSGRAYDFEDSGYESAGSSPAVRPSTASVARRSSYDWVCRIMNAFMVRGTGSPVQWLLDLRAYGMKIHYNTTASGHVDWKDGQTLSYKSIAFTMDQFRGMVHELRIAARQTLFEGVLFAPDGVDVPAVPWATMYDDPVNSAIGWNFLQDPRTTWPVEGEQWMADRIRHRPELSEQFARPGSDMGIDRERFRDYMRQVVRFRGMLLVLMHLTGGQPARGPEILSVRHRNTAQGGHRNLFIEDGAVVFVTRYHKGAAISGDVKIIHRYLPREVGELVVWYLWLALPFIQRMEAMLSGQERIKDHLWPTDPDGKQWTTERMRKELQRVSTASLGQGITVAAYRQMAIAISRQHVRGATQFQADGADEGEEWRQQHAMDEAADEQATHSADIAGRLYARQSMEMFGSTATGRERFRAVSTDWHRFLAFESTQRQDERTEAKRKRTAHEHGAVEEQTARRMRLQRMDAEAELRWMLRKEVTLRSAQGAAMRAIQDGESFIVAVMPTGAGKSVLFMLPAFVEAGGVSIVVVPLRALRKDMVYRCRQLGIRVGTWSRRNQCDGASIVLVTPEKAADPEFATFIQRSRQTRRLDRIVIDECHVVLNDQQDFRPQLQQLGRLGSAETQMVLLTATLPPTEEDELLRRMYWRREEVRLIRASTVRTNIRYSVVDGRRTKRERMEQLEEMVGAVLRDAAQPEGKVVVMCESKPKVRQIADAGLFPCEAFHADIEGERREEISDEFREGRVRVVVATGAFGMGIDIPDIRLIVHVDCPRNMRDYGQASGRAGRDGLTSQAIIIRGGRDFEDDGITQYMDEHQRVCRRVDIDRYLDGDQERSGCVEGEEPCDICDERVERADRSPRMDVSRSVDIPSSTAMSSPIAPRTEGVPSSIDRSSRFGSGRRDVFRSFEMSSSPGAGVGGREPVYATVSHAGGLPTPQTTRGALSRVPYPSSPPPVPLASSPSIPRQGGWYGFDSYSTLVAKQQEHRGREPDMPFMREESVRARPSGRVDRSDEIEQEQQQQQQVRIRQQDRERRRPQERQIEQERRRAQMWEDLRRQLDGWKGICVVCRQAGRPYRHAVTECPSREGQEANEFRQQARAGARFTQGDICYNCVVPRWMCDRWTDDGVTDRGKGLCQWWGIMFGVVCAVPFAHRSLWEQWVAQEQGWPAGQSTGDGRAIGTFMSHDVEEDGVKQVRLGRAFLWFTQRIEREERE